MATGKGCFGLRKFKRDGACMPLGQMNTVWIRTGGNYSLSKHKSLTTERLLQIPDDKKQNIVVYVVELQKRNLQPENTLKCVVAASQLWC